MSATNRGAVREEYDFYCTPMYTIRALMENFNMDPYRNILEPAAGDDALVAVMNNYKHADAIIHTNDIRQETAAMHHFDYIHNLPGLEEALDAPPDLIITNPPYRYAKEFIMNSLDLVAANGKVIMLLRINYLGAQTRHLWWQRVMPFLDEILVLSSRPKFTNGSSDATEYAWFVFNATPGEPYAKTRVIDDPIMVEKYRHKAERNL